MGYSYKILKNTHVEVVKGDDLGTKIVIKNFNVKIYNQTFSLMLEVSVSSIVR